jgi:hypothetical protein
MKSPKQTIDSLGIFWEGEERNGILTYGLWHSDNAEKPEFNISRWPLGTQIRSRKLHGKSWSVWMFEVLIESWPSDDSWAFTIQSTLEDICRSGAVVSWCALEGCFVDPPLLFLPSEIGNCVWAVSMPSVASEGPPQLRELFHPVSDSTIKKIHERISRHEST